MKSETIAITRALRALVAAIDEMDDAVVKLALSQGQQLQEDVNKRLQEDVNKSLQEDVNKSLIASREATAQCLVQIQTLLLLMGEGRE
jgi:hypothetical protein